MSRAEAAAKLLAAAKASPHRRGREPWATVVTFDSAFAPCGCVIDTFVSVECTSVEWRRIDGRYHLRCLTCGHEWTRAFVSRGTNLGLNLDSQHPEELARRAS